MECVMKKEETKRFVTQDGMAEYTQDELKEMGEGTEEKDFDNQRYKTRVCAGCRTGCGKGSCPRI